MAKEFVAIKLKKLSYADVPASGLPSAWTDIDVIVDESFEYVMPEESVDPYINAIDGQAYHIDTSTTGELAINFSIGQYDLELKAKLQGGTYTAAAVGAEATWVPATTKTPIYKAFKAVTQDGVSIIFPQARVITGVTKNKSQLALSLKAIAVTPSDSTLPIEKWGDGAPLS